MHKDQEGAFAAQVVEQQVEEAVNDEGLRQRISTARLTCGGIPRTSYMSRSASMTNAASSEKREIREEMA